MFKKIIFFIILIFLIGVFLPLDKLMAQEEGYEIEVSIPSFGDEAKAGQKVTLADYIRYIYLFALAAVGVTALGVLVYGGFQYMTSDLVTSKEEAKKWIWGALSGLVLALAAYLILNTINPDLVEIREPRLEEGIIIPSEELIPSYEAPPEEKECTSGNCPSSCEPKLCPDWDEAACFCDWSAAD